uniref:Remorin C-terminal domain-containing protein n=1 Tax=Solanum lycopersicum TaxID=4081 RepID=A0A3Q7FUM6_SOLLC
MDLARANYCEPPSQGEAALEGKNGNPFLDSFPDPLCKLNLKETSEFVKSLPTASNGAAGFLRKEGVSSVTRRNMDAPSTPGRPIFSFSVGNFSRKNFPSKWDDAEKWLVNGSSIQDSPASHHNNNGLKPALESSNLLKQCNGFKLKETENVFAEKNRVTDEKVLLPLHHHHISAGAANTVSAATDVFLKAGKSMKEAIHEIKHRDIGTEMTPIGSSTTSRCHTPFKSPSPARHNNPADRSGPLPLPSSGSDSTVDIMQFEECHLAKLQFGTQFDSVTTNWSSREEEEEDVSKSLRHFEINNECRKSVSESKTRSWEEEEKNKCCLRYQREEAKIQAWVNLQNAKAEAQSKKLEEKALAVTKAFWDSWSAWFPI